MRCETAKGKTCRCRCGGKLHGAARAIDTSDPEFYKTLPRDDPHYARPKRERKKREPKVDICDRPDSLFGGDR
jgi:hypothetical protein